MLITSDTTPRTGLGVSESTGTQHHFPPFVLNLRAGVLRRGEEPVTITPKALEVLAALLRHHPDIVTKEEFAAEVWPGTNVSPTSLHKQIQAVRIALGEFGETYVLNVPKKGYRFAGEIVLESEPAALVEFSQAVTPSPFGFGSLGRKALVGVTVVLLCLNLSSSRLNSKKGPLARPAIAVLELKDLKKNPEDSWLSTAIPTLLGSEIAAGNKVRLVSQDHVNQFLADIPVGEIPNLTPERLIAARDNLKADLVLSGSFLVEKSGTDSTIRLDLAIINTADGSTVASLIETGNSNKLIDLLGHVGSTLRTKLGDAELTNAEQRSLQGDRPRTLDAMQYYGIGLASLRRFEAKKAQPFFAKALESDPKFVLARLSLSDSWSILGYFGKAKQEAEQAFRDSGNLRREEALWIEGRYRELSHQWPEAIEVYRSLLTFYPDNADYGIALARSQASAMKGSDSVKTMVQLKKTDSDPRIDLAIANSMEAVGDFKGELAAAENAERVALAEGANLLAAKAQLKEVWALDNLSEFDKAAELAVRVKGTYARYGDRGGEAFALRNLADVEDDSGKSDQAAKDYDAAIAIFREQGHESNLAMTLNNEGYSFKNRGDLADADHLFQQAADLAGKIGDPRTEAMALNGLATILWRQGHVLEAKNKFEGAFNRFREAGDRSHEASSENNFAIALQDSGHLSEALQGFERSLSASREVGDQVAIARELGNSGELLTRLGKLDQADKRLKEQLSIAETVGNQNQRAYALVDLARLDRISDHLAEARLKVDQAIQTRKKLNKPGLVAEAESEQAETLYELHDYQNAEVAIRDALAEFQREKEVDLEADGWGMLSKILLKTDRKDESLEALDEAARLGESSEDFEVQLSVLTTEGLVYAAIGKRPKALSKLNIALAKAKQIGDEEHLFDAELQIAVLDSRRLKSSSINLDSLKTDAGHKGFLLLARKVGSLVVFTQGNSASHEPQLSR